MERARYLFQRFAQQRKKLKTAINVWLPNSDLTPYKMYNLSF